MKNLISVMSAIAVFIAGACAEEMRTIEGQVFIRTQGAETIKLSLVEVQLFDEKSMAAAVERKRKAAVSIDEYFQLMKREAAEAERHAEDANKRAQRLDPFSDGTTAIKKAAVRAHIVAGFRSIDAEEKAYYPRSADYYFSGLPKPLQTTKTDADGKFVFKMPIGSYVLAAISSRETGEKTEKYHWMVKVAADVANKIMLANDNLSSSGSPDSIIATLRYAPWEYPAYPAMRKLSIEKLAISHAQEMGSFWEQERASEAQIRYLKAQLATPQIRNLDSLAAFIEQEKEQRVVAASKHQAELAAAAESDRQTQLEPFRKDPKLAQRKAIELYPDVGVAGSRLNKEFVARVKRYQSEKKDFFVEPDWPIRLAKECSEDLAAKQLAK